MQSPTLFANNILCKRFFSSASLLYKSSASVARKMPITLNVGTPGEANKAIGGVPTIHYLDWFSRGRGQVIRLLFEDAGISYTDVVCRLFFS
jgi:hypothetical protein